MFAGHHRNLHRWARSQLAHGVKQWISRLVREAKCLLMPRFSPANIGQNGVGHWNTCNCGGYLKYLHWLLTQTGKFCDNSHKVKLYSGRYLFHSYKEDYKYHKILCTLYLLFKIIENHLCLIFKLFHFYLIPKTQLRNEWRTNLTGSCWKIWLLPTGSFLVCQLLATVDDAEAWGWGTRVTVALLSGWKGLRHRSRGNCSPTSAWPLPSSGTWRIT